MCTGLKLFGHPRLHSLSIPSFLTHTPCRRLCRLWGGEVHVANGHHTEKVGIVQAIIREQNGINVKDVTVVREDESRV